MTRARRLLVGVAKAPQRDAPLEYLVDVLKGLHPLGVDIQFAAFDGAPLPGDLAELGEFRTVADLAPRSPAGLAQSLARRVSPRLADKVHDWRATEDLRWMGQPDCIHLDGPGAANLLRYVRSPGVPVTAYVHPHDFNISGLSPLDRDRLIARTTRFFTSAEGGDRAAADLVAAGVDPSCIEPAPQALYFPPPRPTPDQVSRARRALGLPPDALVIGVPPVPGWADRPDLTLAVASELERLGGQRAPHVLWYQMPSDAARRWPIDHEASHMGLTRLRIVGDLPATSPLLDVADLVLLPTHSEIDIPATLLPIAAERSIPVLGWTGHPREEELAGWGGTIIEQPDVTTMAAKLLHLVLDPEALQQAAQPGWRRVVAPIERLMPLELPAPAVRR